MAIVNNVLQDRLLMDVGLAIWQIQTVTAIRLIRIIQVVVLHVQVGQLFQVRVFVAIIVQLDNIGLA
jgi:hypothetical protein